MNTPNDRAAPPGDGPIQATGFGHPARPVGHHVFKMGFLINLKQRLKPFTAGKFYPVTATTTLPTQNNHWLNFSGVLVLPEGAVMQLKLGMTLSPIWAVRL